MMPRLNRAKAKRPAMGSSALAASAAVLMLVTPGLVQGGGGGDHDGDARSDWRRTCPRSCRCGCARCAAGASARRFHQRLLVRLLIHFLHFLGALPEKQIGADGGAEDRDDGGGGVIGEIGVQPDQAGADRSPVQMHEEHQRDIGEQAEGQDSQKAGIAAVGNEELQAQRQQGEGDGGVMLAEARSPAWPTSPIAARSAPTLMVLAMNSSASQAMHQPARHHLAHVVGQPLAGDAADQGADHLDRHHQREGEQQGPEQVEAELGAALAVGGDAAWIVVGGAGDQARPQLLEQGCRVQARAQSGLRPGLGSGSWSWDARLACSREIVAVENKVRIDAIRSCVVHSKKEGEWRIA